MGLMNAGMNSLVWPVLAQILLTLVVLVVMGIFRRKAMMAREVRISEIALKKDAWPSKPQQAANNFTNQFETPVLFYVLSILAIHVGATGWVMVALAWLFVASRIVHAVIHIGSNNMMIRPLAFLVGCVAILGMLIGVFIASV